MEEQDKIVQLMFDCFGRTDRDLAHKIQEICHEQAQSELLSTLRDEVEKLPSCLSCSHDSQGKIGKAEVLNLLNKP